MIIKKQEFEKSGREWPFLVDELKLDKRMSPFCNHISTFYNGKHYAISGSAETMDCLPLEQSGIWADNPETPGTKKSLTPFFNYIEGVLR